MPAEVVTSSSGILKVCVNPGFHTTMVKPSVKEIIIIVMTSHHECGFGTCTQCTPQALEIMIFSDIELTTIYTC